MSGLHPEHAADIREVLRALEQRRIRFLERFPHTMKTRSHGFVVPRVRTQGTPQRFDFGAQGVDIARPLLGVLEITLQRLYQLCDLLQVDGLLRRRCLPGVTEFWI